MRYSRQSLKPSLAKIVFCSLLFSFRTSQERTHFHLLCWSFWAIFFRSFRFLYVFVFSKIVCSNGSCFRSDLFNSRLGRWHRDSGDRLVFPFSLSLFFFCFLNSFFLCPTLRQASWLWLAVLLAPSKLSLSPFILRKTLLHFCFFTVFCFAEKRIEGHDCTAFVWAIKQWCDPRKFYLFWSSSSIP